MNPVNTPAPRPPLPDGWRTPIAKCPDEDASYLERIEVSFALPVLMTQDQQRRLYYLIDEITDSPWNQPQGGVHWLAEYGSKPNWSNRDAVFLGLQTDANAPGDGEPTFDDTVFVFGTCAREFVSEEERVRVHKRRSKTDDDIKPPPPPQPPAGQGDGWRPIETAPKDEEGDPHWCILYSTKEGVVPGYWGPTYFDMRYAWVQYNHRSESIEIEGDITHWCPLPSPPASVQPPAQQQPGGVQGCVELVMEIAALQTEEDGAHDDFDFIRHIHTEARRLAAVLGGGVK